MKIMAYGWVSAKDQNPERQLIKFRELGIDERYVFVDKLSGKILTGHAIRPCV